MPWHRAFIYVFEKKLSAALSRRRRDNGVLTLPYWDWTVFDPTKDNQTGIPHVLSDATYVDEDGTTKDNPLAKARSKWRVENNNAPSGEFTTRNPRTFRSAIPRMRQRVHEFKTQRQYALFMRFQSAFDTGPHGAIHLRVSGDMSRIVSAAYDPIFWLHHCMVDKVWYDWQQIYGDSSVPRGLLARGVYSPDNEPWTVADTLSSEDLFKTTYGIARRFYTRSASHSKRSRTPTCHLY